MRKLLLPLFVIIALSSFAQDTISKTDLISASKLFDLSFTQKEIDTMYDAVKENAENYKLMHKLSLNNAVPLSLWQSPVLPGMKFSEKQEPINWNISNNISLPKDKNELAYYSVAQLASLIKN